MTVLNFKKPEKPAPRVYQCQCGCENFWLYDDGQIECAECNTFHPDMTGYWKTIDPEGETYERPSQSSEGDARVQDRVAAQRLEEGTQSDEP